MPSECIFCRIAQHAIAAYHVGENPQAVAFFDAYPLVRGHTLIIPRRHVAGLADLTDAETHAVFGLVRQVRRALTDGLGITATTMGVNDGAASGQTVPHVHVHLLPRAEGDGVGSLHSLSWPRPRPSATELDALAHRIRRAMAD